LLAIRFPPVIDKNKKSKERKVKKTKKKENKKGKGPVWVSQVGRDSRLLSKKAEQSRSPLLISLPASLAIKKERSLRKKERKK
jgi:hypothetical protein